jgi:hypothetical protein
MPKITEKDLELIQVRLFKDDLMTLRRLYAGSFGVNKAVRTIVHTFVTQTLATANAEIDATETDMAEPAELEETISPEQLEIYRRQLDQ